MERIRRSEKSEADANTKGACLVDFIDEGLDVGVFTVS